jgi:hypothetical protein
VARALGCFEVLFGPTPDGPLASLTPEPLISSLFLHADRAGPGYYRLRAVSLGGAASGTSEAIHA